MDLTIEKLIYGGDGLARIPSDAGGRAKTIFVPFVLPGEQVAAQLTTQKTGFSRARVTDLLVPSTDRITPGCPYFGACGGCHYQHTGYENQLQVKESILRETLARTARVEWEQAIHVHSAQPWGYRNRTRLHVRHEPFAIGYYRHNSHDLLPIAHCPISSPLINRAIAGLLDIGQRQLVPARVQEIELFVNAGDSALLVEVSINIEGSPIVQQVLEGFTAALQSALPEVQGVCGFGVGGQLYPWSKLIWCSGASNLEYKVGGHSYRVQAGSFFQTNRFLAETLVDVVTAGRSGALAFDLFAGTGLFALPLARSFARVIAVESARSSYEDLLRNATSNIEAVELQSEQFLRKRSLGSPPDLAVVDPPRSGLEAKLVASLIEVHPKEVVYVSCDPATLARDLRMLVDGGYRMDALHLVDLFPQTYHLESIAMLSRR